MADVDVPREGQTEEYSPGNTGTIRRVPGNILGFLTSRIAEYLARAADISAEIHECPGQPTKLVLYGGIKDVTHPTGETTYSIQENTSATNKILVKNFPESIDEDMLEAFFESRKTGGGAQVKNFQLNREKNWAVVEFYKADAVARVMSKVPIKIMARELNIRRFTPLLQGEGSIENLEIHNLPKELTDDLLTMQIEGALEATEVSSAEYKSDEGEELEDGDHSMKENTNACPKTDEFVKETITSQEPVQLQMLQKSNYMERVLEQLPEVKAEMNLEKNEISFEGDAQTVLYGYRNLVEALGKLSVNRIGNKPAEYIELYKRERVIEYLNKRLEEQNVVCVWEVIEQVIVICSLKESIVQCTKIIDKSVTEIEFPICRESSATLLTQEWQEEVKQIQDKNDIVYRIFSDKTSTNITVMATDKNVSNIVCRIKEFLKSQLVINSENFDTPVLFRNVYDLNSNLAYKLIDRIAEGLSLYHVTLKPAPNYTHSKFTVTGTREGMELAKKQIAKLEDSF